MESELKCGMFHVWSETVEDMEMKPCDCGKMLWHEEMCGCPGKNEKEFKPILNPNYYSDDN